MSDNDPTPQGKDSLMQVGGRARSDGMEVPYVLANPFRCRMWALHDRLDEYISEETCQEEIESFRRHGQLIPVLGRRLHGDVQHDIELIFGARRLFIARHLGQQIKVHLRGMSDVEALVAMDIENRHRQDISPYERGRSYIRWMTNKHFASQEDLARALHISGSQVCRLIKIAQLPSAIVGAFSRPLDITEAWGLMLAEALTDPDRRATILRKARALAAREERPPARQVFEELMSTAAGVRFRARSRDEVVRSAAGHTLFRVKRQTRTIVLSLPVNSATTRALPEIRDSVARILQRSFQEG
jgi:ParB family transcriptional regulator, chromosome partitioning protein